MTRLLLDTTFLIDADRSGDALDEVIADEDDVVTADATAFANLPDLVVRLQR